MIVPALRKRRKDNSMKTEYIRLIIELLNRIDDPALLAWIYAIVNRIFCQH